MVFVFRSYSLRILLVFPSYSPFVTTLFFAGGFGGIPVAWTRPSISSHGALDTLAGSEQAVARFHGLAFKHRHQARAFGGGQDGHLRTTIVSFAAL